MDDGSRVWIRCNYERVHKLCTKCGLIGHSRGQCTHCMQDIEIMLFRQRLRIQDLHQVQFRFDALQPQFSNDLRAYHNLRRRWTTQIRYGFLNQAHVHANPINLNPPFLDPSTPSSTHSPHATTPTSNFQPLTTSLTLYPLTPHHLTNFTTMNLPYILPLTSSISALLITRLKEIPTFSINCKMQI